MTLTLIAQTQGLTILLTVGLTITQTKDFKTSSAVIETFSNFIHIYKILETTVKHTATVKSVKILQINVFIIK